MCILVSNTSCSSAEGKKVLSFFIDGIEDSTGVESRDTVITVKEKNKDRATINVFETTNFHEPYKGKQCDICHQATGSNKLTDPQPILCYNCHDDFSTKYSFLHGPVASGYCTNCHHPHMSKNKKLLKRTGQKICLECHELNDILKNEIHSSIENTDCTDCHNPHGGEDKFLM